MKRIFVPLLVLALALLPSAAPLLAADYTLEEKLSLQLKNGSGLTAEAKFSVTPGSGFTFMDEASSVLLAALLDGSVLKLKHIKTAGTDRGRQETNLSLLRTEEELAWFRYAEDRSVAVFSSSLLGTQTYAGARGDGLIADLALGGSAEWPDMLPILLTLMTADNEWSVRAAPLMQPYLSRLSIWLQSFTAISLERDVSGQPATRMTVEVTAPALKAQIKQLLMDLFKDADTLALLKEQLGARQAAYMDPGMLNAFLSAVDSLPLSGNIVADRLFDDKGTLVFNSVSLPMAGFRNMDTIDYVFTSKDEGEETSITVAFLPPADAQRGGRIRLNFSGSPLEDGSGGFNWSGALGVLPAEVSEEGFAVEAEDAEPVEKVWSFRLFVLAGEEIYDLPSDRSSREYEVSLAIVPPDGAGAQHLSVKAEMNSGSNTRSATKFSADITLEDQETGASIVARVEGASVPPWSIAVLDPSLSVRLDRLSSAQFVQIREQMQKTLEQSFAALTSALPIR